LGNQIVGLEHQIRTLFQNERTLTAQRDSLTAQLDAAQKAHSKCDSTIADLQAQRKSLTAEVEQLQITAHEATGSHNTLNEQFRDAEQRWSRDMQLLENRLRAALVAHRTCDTTIAQLRAALDAAQHQLAATTQPAAS
jgi:chromosome segregation ATPase